MKAKVLTIDNAALRGALLLLPLFLAAYWVPLRGMANVWLRNEDYSYGFMIPLVTAYLIWEKRESLRTVQIRSAWGALLPLVVMVLVSLYGILGSSGNVSMPAVPLLVMLFTYFCFGGEVLRRLLLPLGFLFFMIPVPAVIERTLGIWLKGISSRLGGEIVRLCGVPVHVSGNVIDLGVSQLQVVDACNGLRYLFPLIALGVLYGHFFEKARWKKLLCVVAALPIAVASNGLRIGVIGILTDRFGPAMAEGFMHDFSGYAVFLIAFLLFFVLGRVLALFPPRQPGSAGGKESAPNQAPATGSSDRHVNRAVLTASLILFLVGGLSLSTHALPAVKLAGGIAGFPLKFGPWSGQADFIDPEIVAKSGAEESFSARYGNGGSDQVSLYIGYRSTAFLENENFFHSPTVCLPSAGWKVLRSTRRTIDNVPRFGSITVTEMLTEQFGSRQLVYFWFQTKSAATHDKNINRFHLALHALRRDNTYDLFIRPIAQVRPGETEAEAERRMDGFVREMMGALSSYIQANAKLGG